MSKKLLIIGCGNVGGFVSYNIGEVGDYNVLGFLDDDVKKHGKTVYGNKVLGTISDISKYIDSTVHVVIAISAPKAKASVVKRLEKYAIDYPSFIFKNVWLSKNVSLGKGVILYPGVSINYETTIGDFVIMNMNCAIGHNATISNFCTLAPGVNLAGFTFLDEGVDVGIGVSTRQNIKVGKNATIGGQSMIVKDVNEGALVKGIPGKEVQ
jgi:sugar O-acyltransferase (sialic acid O-acetyltransferase NeuD family)